ncbi:MAG: glycogen synthase GlgA [Candidatus Binataceae bacterium]
MKIAIVAAEIAPYAKAGGLADVIGAMPAALKAAGAEPAIIVPGYRKLIEAIDSELAAEQIPISLGDREERFSIRRGADSHGVPLYLIEHPGFFGRTGIYGEGGVAYPDNVHRFVFFGRAAAIAAAEFVKPEVLHAHDWHAAAAVTAARADGTLHGQFEPALVAFTIHNLAFQGLSGAADFPLLGIGRKYFSTDCLEFYGRMNLMKGAISLADAVSTVSPAYAREIASGPELGFGLEGVLRAKGENFTGILNGADYNEWDPAHDPHIAAPYSRANPAGKRECARALRAETGLPEREGVPVVGMVTRMTEQKGIGLIRAGLDSLMRLDIQLVMLAAGDPDSERFFHAAERRYPHQLRAMIGFDDAAAHRVQAGSDAFLMPSQFEPCGLTQMYAMRYGTVPVVRATGGLRDTVSEFDPAAGAGTGFMFEKFEPAAMVAAMGRMAAAFRNPPAWRRLMDNCFAADFSWDGAARQYLDWFARLRKARGLG